MDKSLALVLPDRPGVLREVMHILSSHDVDVLRMSYNRVIDIHALFLDVWGTSLNLDEAEEELRAWKFLPGQRDVGVVRLLDLELEDELSSIEPVLALVERHELNITYLNVQTDSGEDSRTQIGLFVHDPAEFEQLLEDLQGCCKVRLVPLSEKPNMLDNNHFNLTFAEGLSKRLGLDAAQEEELLINSNRIMQNLMHEGADPYKPFDYINQLAESFVVYRGATFIEATRITRFETAGGVKCVCIEPPVGSTTWVFECEDRLLCVDAGYCCYAEELVQILRSIYPDWDAWRHELVLTHGDIDHIGACEFFDRVYASGRVIDNFSFEKMGIVNWREQSVLSFPFIRIGNAISCYKTPAIEDMVCLGEESPLGVQEELLKRIDTLEIAPFTFEVWEGKGGHVRGEIVLIDRAHHVCVSGDIFVNVHGETKQQARFNTLAPYLLTSVDSMPDVAREERNALRELLDPGTWQILGGHGGLYVLTI